MRASLLLTPPPIALRRLPGAGRYAPARPTNRQVLVMLLLLKVLRCKGVVRIGVLRRMAGMCFDLTRLHRCVHHRHLGVSSWVVRVHDGSSCRWVGRQVAQITAAAATGAIHHPIPARRTRSHGARARRGHHLEILRERGAMLRYSGVILERGRRRLHSVRVGHVVRIRVIPSIATVSDHLCLLLQIFQLWISE